METNVANLQQHEDMNTPLHHDVIDGRSTVVLWVVGWVGYGWSPGGVK